MKIYKNYNVGLKMVFKTISLISTIVLFSLNYLNAQVYVADSCSVSFFSSAPLEDIEAVSTMPKGSTYSAFNTSTGKLAFKIPIKSFRFANGLMEEHFNENYMESDKYPYASFKGILSTDNEYESAKAEGVFNIHGVEQQRGFVGAWIKSGEKRILKGEFIVQTKDHKIKIPKLLIKNIAEEIKVNVYCEFAIKK